MVGWPQSCIPCSHTRAHTFTHTHTHVHNYVMQTFNCHLTRIHTCTCSCACLWYYEVWMNHSKELFPVSHTYMHEHCSGYSPLREYHIQWSRIETVITPPTLATNIDTYMYMMYTHTHTLTHTLTHTHAHTHSHTHTHTHIHTHTHTHSHTHTHTTHTHTHSKAGALQHHPLGSCRWQSPIFLLHVQPSLLQGQGGALWRRDQSLGTPPTSWDVQQRYAGWDSDGGRGGGVCQEDHPRQSHSEV